MSDTQTLTRDDVERILHEYMADRCPGTGLTLPVIQAQVDGQLREMIFIPLQLRKVDGAYDWDAYRQAKDWGQFFEDHKFTTFDVIREREKRGRILVHFLSAFVGAIAVLAAGWAWTLVTGLH